MSDASPTRRRWFRFSLRTMLVVVTIVCVVCGYLVWAMHWKRQREAFPKSEAVLRNEKIDYRKSGSDAGVESSSSRADELTESDGMNEIELGKQLLDQNKYEEARTAFKNAISKNSNLAIAHNGLGLSWAYQGNYELAIQEFNTAIKLDGSYLKVRGNRGVSYFRMKRYSESLSDFSHILKVDSSNVEAREQRIKCLLLLGRWEDSLTDCDYLIRLNPKNTTAHFNRGVALFQLDDLAGAMESFNECITIDPNSANAYYQRGVIFFRLKDWKNSINAFARVNILNPHTADASYAMALALAELRQFDKALDFIRKENDALPRNASLLCAEAYILAGSADVKFRDGERANELAKEAVQLAPENPLCQTTLAYTYASLGNFDAAVSTQENAIQNARAWEVSHLKKRLELYRNKQFPKIPSDDDVPLDLFL